MKRTHLPLNGLRVLDAAARHLSFTRAADELAVTPAAVGQQIRALEDTLGVVLFRRTTTRAGTDARGRGRARRAAPRLPRSSRKRCARCRRARSSKSLTIAAPRDLTAKWLMPRLAEIARERRRAALRAGRRPTRRSISPRPISISRSAGARARASMRARRSNPRAWSRSSARAAGVDTRDRLARLPRRRCASRWCASPMRAWRSMPRRRGWAARPCPNCSPRADIAAGRVVRIGERRAVAHRLLAGRAAAAMAAEEGQGAGRGAGRMSEHAGPRDRAAAAAAATVDDAEALYPTLSRRRADDYWSSAPHQSLEETRAYLAPRIDRDRLARLGDHVDRVTTPRSARVAAGEKRQGGVTEIGYMLARDALGAGHRRRGGVAADRPAVRRGGQRRMFADTDPENAASQSRCSNGSASSAKGICAANGKRISACATA